MLELKSNKTLYNSIFNSITPVGIHMKIAQEIRRDREIPEENLLCSDNESSVEHKELGQSVVRQYLICL